MRAGGQVWQTENSGVMRKSSAVWQAAAEAIVNNQIKYPNQAPNQNSCYGFKGLFFQLLLPAVI